MPDHVRDTDQFSDTKGPDAVGSDMIAYSAKLTGQLRALRDTALPPKPQVEDVLRSEGISLDSLDPAVLTDLVYAEWTLRAEEGETIDDREYLERFPMISDRLVRQWSFDQSLIQLSDVPPWNAPTIPPGGPPSTEKLEFDYIGKYKIVARLGAGGQADVFRGIHPELSRDVVVKVLRPAWRSHGSFVSAPADADVMSVVIQEGRLLAQLTHPNVAQIYDVGQHAGLSFLVMEFVPGLSLDQYQRTHALNWFELARMLADVARAVAVAHQRGIVHRDIKPQNIVVRNDGVPKLIDFGLSQLSDAWNPAEILPGISGTIGFMSPEQARGAGAEIGPSTDIFSLGAVLYFLLTGYPPYCGSSTLTGVCVQALLEKAKQCDWDPRGLEAPGLPVALVAICKRAMAAQPTARYATALEMAAALDSFAGQSKPQRRIFAILAATLVLASTILIFGTPFFKAPQNTGKDAVSASRSAESVRADLKIRVHREAGPLDLSDVVPVSSGEQISIEARIPADFSLMLFVINGDGKLKHIVSTDSQPEDRTWRYPEDVASTVPLTGATGTEGLLVVGRKHQLMHSPDQIQLMWGSDVEWPSVPPHTILRVTGATVVIEQLSRDLGAPQTALLTPTDRVSRTLQRFAEKLTPKFPLVEAVIFCHVTVDE